MKYLQLTNNIQVFSVAPKITDGERMNKVKQNHLQCYNHKQIEIVSVSTANNIVAEK